MASPAEAVDRLQQSLDGRVLLPGSADYDEARTLFNAMIDKRPGLIAQCRTPDDVAAALAAGQESGLEIAVRAGGHSVAGMSLCDGGMVIDVRPMREVQVDPAARTARVGAGCTMSDLDRATQEHGLAVTGGRVSTTGVAGFTLGGGSGWMERKLGLACDNLEAVDLVTADGSQIIASADEHPDLFWALHGGGGNFGVATSFTFNLHPLGPQVLAGLVLHKAERGREVMAALRDFIAGAPDEACVAFAYLTAPPEEGIPENLHGELICGLVVSYGGPVEEAERVLKPLLEFGPPEATLVEPMPYADFQCMIDDPPGYRNYWTADYLDELSDEAIETIASHSEQISRGPAQSLLVPWGGAIARVGEDETPLAHRDAAWVTHPFALWENAADDDYNIAWARGFSADIRRFGSGGVYLNFIGDEGQDRVRAAFGDRKYERLAEIKGRYDPENVFRGNQNIKPRGAEAMAG